MRCVGIVWLIAARASSQRSVFSVARALSARPCRSVNQNSRIERFGFFNRGDETQKLIVVSAA